MDNTQFLRGTEVASKKLAAFSQRATTFGANISRSVGVGLALAGTAAVRTAADYNRAQATLGAIVGKNTQSFKDLTEQSRELGRTTIFTATNVSEAQLEIAKLGFSADRTASIIESSADVAAVFGGSIQDVGKTIAATLNQFGLEAEQSGNVADIMALAFRDSALDISKYREAMKNVGPTAKATGLSLEKTTAVLAVLANNAVDGSLGGTKLRSALSDLAKDSPDVAAALKKLENGTLSYSELLDLLNKRAALVGAILQDQGDEVEIMEKKLLSAAGTTSKLAEALEGELFYNVERLRAATESLGISIGTALEPMIAALADAIEGFAKAIDETDPEVIQAVATALAALATAGVIALIAGQLGTLTNFILGFANKTIPSMVASIAAAEGALAGFYAAFLPGSIIASAGIAVSLFFKKIDEQGDRAMEQFIRQSEKAAEKMQELTATLFEYLDVSQRLEGGGLAEKYGVDSIQEAARQLAIKREELKKLYKDQDDYADLIEEQNRLGKDGDRDERSRLVLKKRFTDQSITGILKEIKELERLQDLLYNNAELTPDPDPVDDTGTEEEFKKLTDLGVKATEVEGIMNRLAAAQAEAQGQFFIDNDELALAQGYADALQSASVALLAINEDDLAALTQEDLEPFQRVARELENAANNSAQLLKNFKTLGVVSPSAVEGVDDLFTLLEGFGKEDIIPIDPLERFKDAALAVADVVGQAFINAADGAMTFGEALRDGFLTAFRAIIGKLITLITLYAILAVLSGGMSMAGGGTFGQGLQGFAKDNSFGNFLQEGFGIGKSARLGGGGGTRSLAINVGGGFSGGDIAFATSSGQSANDRRFG